MTEPTREQIIAAYWQRAEKVTLADALLGTHWLVKTNGAEWGDNDLFLWSFLLLRHHMKPEIVRGRPIWIAKVEMPS